MHDGDADPAHETATGHYALVVDDHPLVARGFAGYMTMACGLTRVHIARSAAECLLRIDRDGPPELAVIDFWLPDGMAPQLLGTLRPRCPHSRLLVVSGDDDPKLADLSRSAGADGYLHKQATPEVFAQAVARLRAGQSWFAEPAPDGGSIDRRELPLRPHELGLTERQGQILSMLLRGQPNKRIARDLHISEQTVKEHVTNILARLGATNRLEVIARMRGRRIEP
ncbi:LuxR C-terminal-related transcriptional regulator [Zoogloea sp.]|uniref:LuxR C-terminal-related transcriptional regulator n=1 Tax=Zoogloea sp. TaxID=49181 RepID=UPI0035B45201